VILRPATVGDVEVVHALDALLFGADAWSQGAVREELTGPGRTAVVACDPDLVGYAVVSAAGDVLDLQRLGVHPDHRRAGIAHALLAEAVAADARVLLEVSAVNEGAIAFYVAEGFTEIARRRRYYRDGSDAVVMQRRGRGTIDA
jgi:ribosomal protein S18 acetylase RimI-like enzyme